MATDSSQTSLRESLLPGRYRVLEQIAVGGMASIWLAEDRVLGRQVAVKVLAEQLASQPLFVTRFEREARTAAALSGHPNLITIYDVGEHEERPFIVMEHLPGGTLRDRIGAGPVDRSEMLEWLRQAASALDFANQRDVVHRDVKPQNLLFDGSGRLVVADLGIARAAYEDSLTASGELIGTASYISPEQAMGDPATPASDRYSLAVVAYELLTGARPFAGGSFAEQAIQQIESEPDPPSARASGLGAEVDRVLLKGLAKDPAARWPTASAFVSALAQALERPAPRPEVATAPLIDPERNWPRQAEPFPTRHGRSPARLAAVAAVVVALAVVAGVVAFGTGGDGGSPNRAKATKHRNAQAKSEAAEPSTTTPTTTAPAPAPPGAPSSGSGAALNEQGYALMRAGRYDQAAPVLQRAVAAFGQSSTELTYAYALYNLGRSLRLSGRPAEAIPYLERRMRFPNQRDVVRRELAAARAATG